MGRVLGLGGSGQAQHTVKLPAAESPQIDLAKGRRMEHRLHIILNTAGCTERCLWPPCFACRDCASPSRTLSWLGFCLRVIGHHALACALAESTDEAWTASLALCLCKAAFQHTGRDCHYEVASSPKHDLIHSYRLHHF